MPIDKTVFANEPTAPLQEPVLSHRAAKSDCEPLTDMSQAILSEPQLCPVRVVFWKRLAQVFGVFPVWLGAGPSLIWDKL